MGITKCATNTGPENVCSGRCPSLSGTNTHCNTDTTGATEGYCAVRH